MTSFYQTRYGKRFTKVVSDLPARIEDMIFIESDQISDLSDYEDIRYLSPLNENIETFPLPLLVRVPDGKGIVIDGRTVYKENMRPRDPIYKRIIEDMALLELQWEKDKDSYGRIMGDLSVIYGQWIISNLSRQYNLNEKDSEIIRLAFTSYFLCLRLVNESSADEIESFLKRNLSRSAGVPTAFIDFLLNEVETEENVKLPALLTKEKQEYQLNRFHHLMGWLNKVIEVEYQDFNEDTLITLMSHSWIGGNRVMLSTVALEHPGTLIALIAATEDFSFYNKTPIANAVKSSRRNSKVSNITDWLSQLRGVSKG